MAPTQADPRLRRRLLVLPACVALLVQGCGVAADKAPPKPAPPVVFEVERNDSSPEANDLGWIKPGDALELRGAIGPAAWDPHDGFTLRAWSDLKLVVELATFDPALVDLHVHDPVLDETVASFGCGCGELRVELDVPAGTVFQLVVGAWDGASDWRLRIAAAAGGWLQPPTGPRATTGAHRVDAARARLFRVDEHEAPDEPDAKLLPVLGGVLVRDAQGRVELFEARLHPRGVVLAPAGPAESAPR